MINKVEARQDVPHHHPQSQSRRQSRRSTHQRCPLFAQISTLPNHAAYATEYLQIWMGRVQRGEMGLSLDDSGQSETARQLQQVGHRWHFYLQFEQFPQKEQVTLQNQPKAQTSVSGSPSASPSSLNYYYLRLVINFMITISNNEQELVLSLLRQNLRFDAREPLRRRQLSVEFLDKPGCLLYSQGSTTVLVKSAMQIVAPKPERPSEGFINFRVDCHCCHANFEQSRKYSVEISKLLETIVIGSHALDVESLCITSGRFVWQLRVDCLVVADNGNVLDSALNGTMLALMDMRKPYVQFSSGQIIVDQDRQQQLSLAHVPVSMTFGLIEENIFADPSFLEDQFAASRITVIMNVYKQICAIHKTGGLGIASSTFSGILKVAEAEVLALVEQFREISKHRRLASDFHQ